MEYRKNKLGIMWISQFWLYVIYYITIQMVYFFGFCSKYVWNLGKFIP